MVIISLKLSLLCTLLWTCQNYHWILSLMASIYLKQVQDNATFVRKISKEQWLARITWGLFDRYLSHAPKSKKKLTSLLSVSLMEDLNNKDRHLKVVKAVDEMRLKVSLMRFKLLMTYPIRHFIKPMACRVFLETYCHYSHYAFQLKKCHLESCAYCLVRSICMPLDQFESFSYSNANVGYQIIC